MKKLFVSLLALIVFASANAQVTETDWASMNDVVALKSCEFPYGSSVVQIPICIKAHEDFQGVTFYVQLPEGLSVQSLDPVVDSRTANIASGNNIHTGHLQSDGTYKVLTTVAGSTSTGAKAYYTKGSADDDYLFAYISVDVSGLAVGEYPMKIVRETQFSKFNETGQPSLMLTDIITTKLVITDEVVIDENATEMPGSYENVKVKVLRTISANNWNTICLPFDMDAAECKAVFGDDVQIADFSSYNEKYDDSDENVVTIDVIFDDVTSIEANHPYIIKVSNRIEEFHLVGKDIVPEENPVVEYDNGLTGKRRVVYGSFYGTYVANTVLSDPDYLFLSGNKFYYSNGSTKMKGLRGYFDFMDVLADKSVDSGSKIRFTVNGGATSIDDVVEFEKVAEGVYTVSGVKVSDSSLEGLPKGVYIVNGKKVLVK